VIILNLIPTSLSAFMLAQINLFTRFWTTSVWTTLISSSHLRVWLPSSPLPSDFPTKLVYVLHIYLMRVTCPPPRSVLFLSLPPNIPSPQHPALKHPRHTPFLQFIRQSFCPGTWIYVSIVTLISTSLRYNVNLLMGSYLRKFTSIPFKIQYTVITCRKAFICSVKL